MATGERKYLGRKFGGVLALSACAMMGLAAQQLPGNTLPGSPAQAPATHAAPLSLADARRSAWKSLTEGADNKNADDRALAVSALAVLGSQPEAIVLVEAGLQDKSYEVRQAAATALGAMKSRSSIPKLRDRLDDESAPVVFASAQALWEMGDFSGESIFAQVLAGDRKVSPTMFQTGFHDMNEKLHDPLALAEFGAEQSAGAFLGPAGFGVPVVEELAKDKTVPARALSARLLGQGKDAASRQALEQALHDRSWIVRAEAAVGLGQMGARSDVGTLLPLLNDGTPQFRYKVAAAILRLTARR